MNKKAKAGTRHQQGVVLISCVAFLLLILLMLRISLSSSKLSEQKAGIDLEIVSAEESAQLALRDAEQSILDVSKQAKALLTTLCLDENDKSRDCEEAASRVRQQAWSNAWSTTSTAVSVVTQSTAESAAADTLSATLGSTPGYYAGIAMANSCANKASWQCVDWNPTDKTLFFAPGYDSADGTLPSRAARNITLLSDRIDIEPRYIIERFLPGEVSMPTDANMLLRVTAVGYGYSAGDNSDGVTSVMYQANYTL